MEKESFLLNYVLKEKELPGFMESITNIDTGEVLPLDSLRDSNFKGSKGLSIYDLPGYFQIQIRNNELLNFSAPLYYGYKVNLFQYKDFEDYLLLKVRKARYSQLRRYRKRLDKCLNPRYEIYYGGIEKQEYDLLFKHLKKMIVRRFREKEEFNFELPYLDFYKSVMYALIRKKKAALFAIYVDSKPICVTLNFIFNNTVYHWNSAYDIDYSMFNLGHINTYNHLEWSFSQGFTGFDMGRGDFLHKRKWVDTRYRYIQVQFIPSGNLLLSVRAILIDAFLSIRFHGINILKQLKVHILISKINKLIYRVRTTAETDSNPVDIKILEEGVNLSNKEEYNTIKPEEIEGSLLLKQLNFFLHQSQENYFQLLIYRKKDNPNIMAFQGVKKYRVILIPQD